MYLGQNKIAGGGGGGGEGRGVEIVRDFTSM